MPSYLETLTAEEIKKDRKPQSIFACHNAKKYLTVKAILLADVDISTKYSYKNLIHLA
ncbi:hypothetical protein APA_4390 [Pseudanabaena sp. lw0831]|nr:hypothetical protein APA_4390 [Pseudanabaena sp. lw0831]